MEWPVTYDMYAQLPDDGKRYEVLDGVLELMSPGPAAPHQLVGGALYMLMQSCCSSDYEVFMAPLDVILSPTNVVQPDLILVHRSRLDIVKLRGIEGAPDLVVEVLSPGSRKRDRVRKAAIYARHGVPEYWIVDAQAGTLEQYTLENGQYVPGNLFEGEDKVVSDKLPCASFAVGELFRNPLIRKLLS
ncbi:Uma2 family endonuclease [Cohnella fermenti]|uniref:Uma2 family endonuclease n=2 Tax=Cohnella fermenti TaxID=2565925 RepID=A0A4S4BKI7_9BACL|nr:Uma2 family endonuclease [Cohnella fermenti]